MPTFISVEPSSVCQLNCPQCPCGTGATLHDQQGSFLTIDTFRKILDDCHSWVHTMQFYFQGEPLLNTHLPQMINMAHRRHIYTICSTNAQAFTPLLAEQLLRAGLDRIIVSIDGLSEESYSAYRRGGSLNKALQGLVYLRQAKDSLRASTHIELQCLMLKSNEHEWSMFQRSFRQMGADSLSLKTAQFYDYKLGNELMPSNPKYSRYCKTDSGTYMPKNRKQAMLNKTCQRIQMGCVIRVNGDVLPCCFDKSGNYIMGNVLTQSLSAIWRGNEFRQFRRQVKADRLQLPMCGNCTEN